MNVILTDGGEAVPATEKTLAVGKEKDTKDTKKPAEEKSVKVDEAVKETKEVPADETEKETEKVEETPTVATSKKDDVEMRDTDEKLVGAVEEEEETGQAKVTVDEKEAVEASA